MIKLIRRLNINKKQRAVGIQFLTVFGLTYASLVSFKLLIPAIILLCLTTYITNKQLITTKKNSVLLVKTIRPIVFFVGLVLLVGVAGNREYPALIITALSILVSGLFAVFSHYELMVEPLPLAEHIMSLVLIFLIANSTSIILALTGIPVWFVVAISWILYFVVANSWLYFVTERPENLALIWALIALEISILSAFWIIFYNLPKLNLLVSQNALIITTLGYSLGGIYYNFKKRTLSRALIFEYLSVSIIVFAVLIVLTRWRTTV